MIGDTLPTPIDFAPSGVTGFDVSPGRPALFVADGGNMNTAEEQVRLGLDRFKLLHSAINFCSHLISLSIFFYGLALFC